MSPIKSTTSKQVRLTIELFGTAKLAIGRGKIDISVPEIASPEDLATALATAYPDCLGSIVREDRIGLTESYIFNLNGLRFLDRHSTRLVPADTLLLFSSQAGG